MYNIMLDVPSHHHIRTHPDDVSIVAANKSELLCISHLPLKDNTINIPLFSSLNISSYEHRWSSNPRTAFVEPELNLSQLDSPSGSGPKNNEYLGLACDRHFTPLHQQWITCGDFGGDSPGSGHFPPLLGTSIVTFRTSSLHENTCLADD